MDADSNAALADACTGCGSSMLVQAPCIARGTCRDELLDTRRWQGADVAVRLHQSLMKLFGVSAGGAAGLGGVFQGKMCCEWRLMASIRDGTI